MGLKVYPHHRPPPPPPPPPLRTRIVNKLTEATFDVTMYSDVIKVLNLTPDGLKYNVGWAPCKTSYPKRKQGGHFGLEPFTIIITV